MRTLVTSDYPILPETWSPDGTHLVFREIAPTPDLYIADAREPESKRPYVATDFSEHSATFSPSGKWVAYVSDQTGSVEVYVRPFPGPGRERRVSRGGGWSPTWGRDDSELFFRSNDARFLMAVTLRLDIPDAVVAPRRLFDFTPFWDPPEYRSFDAERNGERLLMLNQRASETTSSELRVVENWTLK